MPKMIVFMCPQSGGAVPVAVIRGEDLLRQRPNDEIQIICGECGQIHEWKVSDGQIADSEDKGNSHTLREK